MKDRKPRGFATMTPEQRRRLSSLGGKASQAKGTSHRWTREEALVAGKKGGEGTRRKWLAHKKGDAS
jgi:hypothetical protein